MQASALAHCRNRIDRAAAPSQSLRENVVARRIPLPFLALFLVGPFPAPGCGFVTGA